MNAPQSLTAKPQYSTTYDHGRIRKALRKGRERGCSIYIPAEELVKAGIDPEGPAPSYRIWAGASGGIAVRLYKPIPNDGYKVKA